jgi:UDP-N-acetylmuramoyl-L-alanyl-D-glutamate--2,6-diaminopimelate ligase
LEVLKVTLEKLIKDLHGMKSVHGDTLTDITSLCMDSRKAAPGSLFFCISGLTRDAHDFAPQAVEKGAAALVVAVILAYRGKSLLTVSLAASAAVMVTEWLMAILS